MPPSTAPPLQTGAEPLLAAVALELQTRRWHLGFGPALEARLEADLGSARRRELVRNGLVALLVFNLFLLNDAHVRPEVLGTALLWRLGFMTVLGGAVLALVHRGVSPRWRERLMAATLPLAMGSAGMIFWHTRGDAATYDLFVLSLIFLAGNIAYPLRFSHALVSSAVSLALAAGFALAHPSLPLAALPFALGQLAGTAVFSLVACHRMEIAARRSYLLTLREELRTQAAQRSAESFERLAQTDAMTQLANRRAFDEALQHRCAEVRPRQAGPALLLIDVDHFKRYNDRHGHPAGDACLQRVAAALREHARDTDLVARVGGEEFAVLLPPGPPEAPEVAEALAERLRRAVEALALPHGGLAGQPLVTISLGLAVRAAGDGSPPEALLQRADAALYQAKHGGRNRWCRAAD